jgi:hypothetical protein
MSTDVTLTLPDPVYQQAEKIAQSTRRNVQEVLTEVITQNLHPFPVHDNREAMLLEIDGYKVLHPKLVREHRGEYVAIFEGNLVDHDEDPVELSKRVRKAHPDKTVLQRQVEDEPDRVLHFRSPRLLPKMS